VVQELALVRVVQQMVIPVVTLTLVGFVMLKVVEVVTSQLRAVRVVMLLLALVTFGIVVVEAVTVQDHNSLQVVVAVQDLVVMVSTVLMFHLP